METFDAFFSTIYGVDPEEEKRKEQLITEGVYLVKEPQKYPNQIVATRIMIPEKLKEFEQEIKDLYESSNSVYFKVIYF